MVEGLLRGSTLAIGSSNTLGKGLYWGGRVCSLVPAACAKEVESISFQMVLGLFFRILYAKFHSFCFLQRAAWYQRFES